ncbi:MAG: LysM peptidoglycan-binding domain-containing protein, partial [Planctomycetota bacterium]
MDGDTLWDLAQDYYGNPFDWRRIWDANQSEIADPNLIVPGQVLNIPDGTAAVTDVMVEGPTQEPVEPVQAVRANLAEERTIFFQDTSVVQAGVVRGSEIDYLAVPRDLVYSAPWLSGLVGDPVNHGTISGFASGATPGGTVRSYDRITVDVTGATPRVGDRFQLFRVSYLLADVGQVVAPTGVA